MRKIILLPVLLCIACFTGHAQFKQIAQGPVFDEPEEGFAKILQMKNGNTVYAHITLKDGINIRIYDAAHTEKAVTTINPSYEELKKEDEIEAVFEINTNIVILINRCDEDRFPTLIRLIIDGTTGKLKQQKVIAKLKSEWKPSPFIITDPPHFFVVRKDPNSDNYAVAVRNNIRTVYGNKTDVLSPLEITHYGSDNNEISRKLCNLNGDGLDCYFIDMVVLGADKVIAFVRSGKSPQVTNSFAVIEKGAIKYNEVNTPGTGFRSFYTLKYNPASKKTIMMITGLIDPKKDEYTTFLYMIDDANKTQQVNDFGISQKLQDGYKEALDKKKDYQGMPQDLVINDDGSFTVLYEEILAVRNNSGNGTELGVTVASTYDKDGKMISDFLIPKKHWIINNMLYPFYVQERALAAQQLFKGNQYKSFTYLDGSKNKYVLFNDTERNNDIKNERLVSVNGVLMRSKLIMVTGVTGDCDAYTYSLSGNETVPKRAYLFGEKDKGHALALLTISDYNKQHNCYATLMLDKENIRQKKVSMVWLEPQ